MDQSSWCGALCAGYSRVLVSSLACGPEPFMVNLKMVWTGWKRYILVERQWKQLKKLNTLLTRSLNLRVLFQEKYQMLFISLYNH